MSSSLIYVDYKKDVGQVDDDNEYTPSAEDVTAEETKIVSDKISLSKATFTFGIFLGEQTFELDETEKKVFFILGDKKEGKQIGLNKVSKCLQKGASLIVNKESNRYIKKSFLISYFFQIPNFQHFSFIIPNEFFEKLSYATLYLSLITYKYGYTSTIVKTIITALNILDVGIAASINDLIKNVKMSYPHKIREMILAIFKKQMREMKNRIDQLTSLSVLKLDVENTNQLSIISWEIRVDEIIRKEQSDLPATNSIVIFLKKTTEELIKLYNKQQEIFEEKKNFFKIQRRIIEEFFKNLSITKALKSSGVIYSMHSIPSLLNFSQRLANCEQLSPEDRLISENCRDSLHSISDIKSVVPLSILQSTIERTWMDMKDYIDEKCFTYFQDLTNNVLESISYEEMWVHCLTMKGMLYEYFIAQDHRLLFVPEPCKPSLLDIIRYHYPKDVDTFLLRSSKMSYVRDLKPDFYIVRSDSPPLLIPDGKWYTGAIASLLKAEEKDEEGGTFAYNYYNTANMTRASSLINRLFHTSEEQGQYKLSIETSRKASDEVRNLTIVEVGYQTSAEGKVKLDTTKWKPVQSIFESMKFSFKLISVADSSENIRETSWVTKDHSYLLFKWIAQIMGKLTGSMPPGSTDLAVGEISSQKLRSLTKSNRATKTPILVENVKDVLKVCKDEIFKRPTGVIVPTTIQKQFYKTLVAGSTITAHEADRIYDWLDQNAQTIINNVESSENAFEYIDRNSSVKFLLGTYHEELTSLSNLMCGEISPLCESLLSINKKITTNTYLPEDLDVASKLLTKYTESITSHNPETHRCECRLIKQNFPWTIQLLSTLEKEVTLGTTEGVEVVIKSSLDKLCHVILAGKTGRQKETKSVYIRLMESLSRCTPGTFKDSKGLLLCSVRDLMEKSNSRHYESATKEERGLDKKLNINDNKSIKTIEKQFLGKNKPKKNLVEYCEKMYNRLLNKKDTLTTVTLNVLSDFMNDLVSNSMDPSIETCEQLLDSFSPKSYIFGDHLWNSVYHIMSRSVYINPIENTIKSQKNKINKFLDKKRDDRYRIHCLPEIDSQLKMLKPLLQFNDTCDGNQIIKQFIFDVIYERFKDQYLITGIYSHARKFVQIMQHSRLVQVLYAYSKICELYLNFISEMSSTGLKVGKVKETNLNLISRLNKNRETNSSCLLTDLQFRKISSIFYLNRNKAVLGQGYVYCYIITLYESVQIQKASHSILEDTEAKIIEKLKTLTESLGSALTKDILYITRHGYSSWKSTNCRGDLLGKPGNNPLNSLCCTIASFTVNFSLVFTPALMNNSRKLSKFSQMYRYPSVLCISKYGFPFGVGKKNELIVRSSDIYVMKMYQIMVSFLNIDNTDDIRINWKVNGGEPASKMLSLFLYPYSCTVSRQMLMDIYYCHIFNKEMDDFGGGSIRVLNEVCDKILDWEEDLRETIEELNTLGNSHEDSIVKKRAGLQHRIQSLMGVKDVICKDIDEEFLTKQDPHMPSTSTIESLASSPTKSNETSIDKIRKKKKRVRFLEGSDTSRKSSSLTGFTDISKTESSHDATSKVTLAYQVDMVTKEMKKYTMGVPEIVQAFAERAKGMYTSFNIQRALKSKRNNEQVSSITETTSIISDPKQAFSLENGLKTVISKDAIKLAKNMNRSNRISMSLAVKQGNFEKEISEILMLEEDKQVIAIKSFEDTLKAMRNLNSRSWPGICTSTFKNVIQSDSSTSIFTFIKSMWRKIKIESKEFKKEFKKTSDCLLKSLEILGKGGCSERQYTLGVKKDYKKTLDIIASVREKVFFDVLKVCLERDNDIETAKSNLSMVYKKFTLAQVKLHYLEQENRNHPEISYPEEERTLIEFENDMQTNYAKELLTLCLLKIATQMCNVHSFSDGHFTSAYLNEIKLFSVEGVSDSIDGNKIKFRSNLSRFLINLIKTFNTSGTLYKLLCKYTTPMDYAAFVLLNNYCELLIQDIRKPIQMKVLGSEISIKPHTELQTQVKEIIAKSDEKVASFDFSLTIHLCVKGSLQLARKLLERREKGIKLPRSTRSKVIYEMIRLVKTTNTTNVQEMGFQLVTNLSHRFFAAIAPKAQIGGDRDLLVMESWMKVIIHVCEAFSKSLMAASVDNDGLTNKQLKEQILDKAQKSLVFDAPSSSNIKTDNYGGKLLNFYKTMVISGDCSKWGPIHCTSYFSILMQQLLPDNQDWVNYYKIVMIKSLYKQLEIPNAALEKILHSLAMNEEFKKKISGYRKEGDEEKKLAAMGDIVSKYWEKNETAVKLVVNYLCKGTRTINAYNHMGQGIHHASSSLFGNVCAKSIDDLMTSYLTRNFPMCRVEINSAGSSDDFIKVITISGSAGEIEFERMSSNYDLYMRHALNLMTGLMRCCQMLVSEKSVTGDILAEFYSEFNLYDSVSPSPIKFITNQIINSSVTSPLTLYNSTHVECQQAMYNSVPLSTIFLLAIFKQMIYINNSLEFYNMYGLSVLNSNSTMGALYLPTYSKLLTSANSLFDLEQILESAAYFSIGGGYGMFNKSEDSENLNEQALKIEREQDKWSSSGATESVKSKESQENLKLTSIDIVDEESPTRLSKEQQITLGHLVNLLSMKYYNSSDTVMQEEGFNKLQDYSSRSFLSDPFIQLIPESVKIMIEQVKAIRQEQTKLEDKLDYLNPLYFISSVILSKTTVTEHYEFEVSRLEQAMSSKDVVWGLVGGIRQISIPIHKQMLRAYLFNNKTPFQIKECWIKKDSSHYVDTCNKRIDPTHRIKVHSYLDKTFHSKVVLEQSGEVDISTVTNVPIEIVDDGEHRSQIIIHTDALLQYYNIVSGLIEDLKDNNTKNLECIETLKKMELRPLNRPSIRKSKLIKADKLSGLYNNPSVVIAYILHQGALLDSLPASLNYIQLGTDMHTMENSFPNINNHIRKIKTKAEESTKITKDELLNLARELIGVSRIITKGRGIYQSLYVLCEDEIGSDLNDSTILYRYNSIEGMILKTEKTEFLKPQDTSLFTLMGVLSCINWRLSLNEDKTAMLIRFLRSNLTTMTDRCERIKCHYCKLLSENKYELPGTTVSTFFYDESVTPKKREKSHFLRTLSSLGGKSNDLMRSNDSFEYRTELDFRGTPSSGTFTFSSDEGTATGHCFNQVLYALLSKPQSSLLNSLEIPILKEFRVDIANMAPHVIREHFFKLLPSIEDNNYKLPNDYYKVFLGDDNLYRIIPCSSTKDFKSKLTARVIFVADQNLVTRYRHPIEKSKNIELKWTKNYLYIYLSVEMKDLMPSESLMSVEEKIKNHFTGVKKEQFFRKINSNSRSNLIDKIPLESSVSDLSFAIAHVIMSHPTCLVSSSPLSPLTVITRQSSDNTGLEPLDNEENTEKAFGPPLEHTEEHFRLVVKPILKELNGLENIYPIFMVLKHFGYYDCKLSYGGINSTGISKIGSWNYDQLETYPASRIQTVVKNIKKLSKNQLFKEYIYLLDSCSLETTILDDTISISKYFSNMKCNKNISIILLYLSSVFITKQCIHSMRTVLAPSSAIIQRIVESKPLISHKFPSGKEISLEYVMEKLSLCFYIPLLVRRGGENNFAAAFRKHFPNYLMFDKLNLEKNFQTILNISKVKVSYYLSDIIKFHELLVVIGSYMESQESESTADNIISSATYAILYTCTRGNINLGLVPKLYAEMYIRGSNLIGPTIDAYEEMPDDLKAQEENFFNNPGQYLGDIAGPSGLNTQNLIDNFSPEDMNSDDED